MLTRDLNNGIVAGAWDRGFGGARWGRRALHGPSRRPELATEGLADFRRLPSGRQGRFALRACWGPQPRPYG
eukprot:6259080-Alexandrium_andersonii.AAC.1